MPKDLFSTQADTYAKYRPTYPPELLAYIISFVTDKNCAWDCATGNGQAAAVLAETFATVEATDLSGEQLKYAVQKENIRYSVSTAEETSFADNQFDLITIATAYHWFNWKAFHTEATRVCKPGAVVAAWAYHTFYSTDEKVTALINHFYQDVIYDYWDKERRYVEDRYTTVEFEFAPLPTKDFELVLQWKKDDLLGYLGSWSAVQNYIKKHGASPLPLIEKALAEAWPDEEERQIRFPIFVRIGRVIK